MAILGTQLCMRSLAIPLAKEVDSIEGQQADSTFRKLAFADAVAEWPSGRVAEWLKLPVSGAAPS